MNIEDYFKEKKGITVDAARNGRMRFTAIDICRFAKKYHESEELSLPDAKPKLKYVKKDKHGINIHEGQKFRFKFYKELDNPLELIGSFDWNDAELRFEIDIHDNERYVCLSYHGNGVMDDFELITNPNQK